MASLPVEIIDDEILPKLPPKSLVRFKSVSKEFNSLISSPNFINLHLINSLSSDANPLLVINHGGPHLVDLENPQLPPSRIPIPASFRPDGYKPIAGSCNGLLLLRPEYENEYLLINPYTGLHSLLDLSRTLFGFGYDPYADDYKIVMIESETKDSMLVYSASNGISRSVTRNNNPKEQETIMDRIPQSCDPVVFNGRLFHWLIWCPDLKKHRIVCFDICIENWTVDVPVPNYEDPSSDSGMHFAELLVKYGKDKRNDLAKLGVFEGCLCVLAESTVHAGMDVWVMKEYGVVGSWVKLFRVPNRKYAPLTYVRGSSFKVLLLEDHRNGRRQLISYDIQNEKSEKADIHDKHKVRHFYQGCIFKGSFVNLPKNTSS